jgi:hypothetical protein
MKWLLSIAMTVIGVIVLLLCYYHWDSRKNRGYEFGYYGEFNTVSNALARMNGVKILDSWYNADVSLEEFGFYFRTADGRTNRIAFGESAPMRKLSGPQLEQALDTAIKQAAATGAVESSLEHQ